MNKITPLVLCVMLACCVSDSNMVGNTGADPALILYRRENDFAFTVKFANESAPINSNRGYEVRYRTKGVIDGGLTPTQTVCSDPPHASRVWLGRHRQRGYLALFAAARGHALCEKVIFSY